MKTMILQHIVGLFITLDIRLGYLIQGKRMLNNFSKIVNLNNLIKNL